MKKLYSTFQAVIALMMLLCGTNVALAITTQEMPLGELISGQTYTVPENTLVTGQFTAPSDGSITLQSSVDANTNLVPYSDSGFTTVVNSTRDEAARTKTFDAISGTTYYFKQTTTPTTSFDVTFTFTAVQTPGESIPGAPIATSPEAGSTVESLSEITLSFGKDYYPGGVNYDYIAVPKVYNAEGEAVEVTASWAFDWSDFQNLILKLNPALTEAGTYTIKFPAGAVKDFDNMSITSPEFELVYTIEGGGSSTLDVSASIDPKEGAVAILNEFTVTFEGVESVAMADDASQMPYLATVDGNGNLTKLSNLMVFPASSANQLSLGTYDDIIEPGKYAVVIPSSSLVFNADANLVSKTEEFIFHYEIKSASQSDIEPFAGFASIEPADKSVVKSLQTFIIKFESGMTNVNFSSTGLATIKDSEGNIITSFGVNDSNCIKMDWLDDTVLKLIFPEEITTEGEYTVNFPAEFFLYGITTGGASKSFAGEMTFTYTVKDESKGALPISIDPEAGSVVEELTGVKFTFSAEDYPGTMIYNESEKVEVYDAEGNLVTIGGYGYADATYYTINSVFEKAITEPGTYTVKVGEGHLFEYGVENPKICPAFEVQYTVGKVDNITAAWSIEEGAEVEKFESVSVTFENAQSVRSVTLYPEVFYAVAEDGSLSLVKNYCNAGVLDASAVGNVLTYTVDYENCYTELVAGNYRIVVPVGSVYFNGDENNKNTEEYVLNFSIKESGSGDTNYGALPISIDPENGSTVEKLTGVTFTFSAEDYPGTMNYDWNSKAEVYDADGNLVTIGGYGYADAPVFMSINTTFEKAITEPGTYTVKVAEGNIFEYTDNVSEMKICPAFEVTYIVKEGGSGGATQIEVTATVDPAEGVVDKLSDFTVTFEGADKVAMHEYAAKFPYVALVDEDGNIGTTISSTMVFPFADQPNQLSIGTHAEVTDAGKYALVVPAESLVFNGNEEITVAQENFIFYYEIEGAKPQYSISVSPAAGEVSTDDMKVITITFEGVSKVEFNDISSQGSLYKLNEDGSYAKEYQSTPLLISDVAYTFTPFYPPTELGNYRLIIPARAVYVTDTAGVTGPNDEYVVDYQITTLGIGGISEDATDLTVYGIDGVCVLRNATAQDLKNLQKGIYIVNGKKVAIR